MMGSLAQDDDYGYTDLGIPIGARTEDPGRLPAWIMSGLANPGPYEAQVGMWPNPTRKALPDVGQPLISSGEFSPGVPAVNRAANVASNVANDYLIPKTPLDVGLTIATGGGSVPWRIGALATGAALDSDEAQAAKLPKGLGEVLNPRLRAKAEGLFGKWAKYAEEYPPTGPGAPSLDPGTGKPYMAKANIPEVEQFMKDRKAIQADMDANGYVPYFDPAQRFHVDPSKYPAMLDTAQDLPVKADTILKWTNHIDTPETRALLQRAYQVGQTVPNAKNWYMMGQLERKYIDELGEQLGRTKFREDFGGAMAATTGGASPSENFLMGHYGNYMRYKGQDFPRWTPEEHQAVKDFAESQGKQYVDAKGRPINKTGDIASFKVPSPVGGQYASGNLDQYDRIFKEVAAGKDIGQAMADSNSKRLDFMQAFEGHPDSFVWDKQMSNTAKLGDQPPSYGIAERVAREEAAKAGVPPQNFQDVGWAGQKAMLEGAKPLGSEFKIEGKYQHGPTGVHHFEYEGPMIEHVNDAIERTHRLTGMPKDEIVRRGIVRAEIPIYALGTGLLAPGVMGALARQDQYSSP